MINDPPVLDEADSILHLPDAEMQVGFTLLLSHSFIHHCVCLEPTIEPSASDDHQSHSTHL